MSTPVKPPTPRGPLATGSSTFNPDTVFRQWSIKPRPLPQNNDLRTSIIQTFSLPQNDQYTYHAIASVTLSQVQEAIDHGRQGGLHAWYRDEEGRVNDIQAYTQVFSPTTTPAKALIAFASNAKKSSIRALSAAYLQSQRLLLSHIVIPRQKNYINPAYDFWAWTSECLEWGGPTPLTEKLQSSRHILPVFMHHFGCVVPSFEALEIIKQETQGCKDSVLLLVYPIVGAEFTKKVLDAYEGTTVVVAGTQNRSGYTAFRDMRIDEWIARERKEYSKTVQVALPSFAGKDEALFVFERKGP
ncbi:MAG: hypothetical protein Q9163_000493 [Psora crenata]